MRQRSTAATLRWDFTILVGFLLLVGLLRFAASGVVAAGLAAQTQAVHETGRANDAVLQALTDAETGVRGYQLTGDPAFLQPYRLGIQTYPASMAGALDKAPNAQLRRLLLDEQAAARAWLTGYGEPVAATPPGHPTLGEHPEQQGKALFDRLRATSAAVDAALDTRRQQLISRFRLATGLSEAVIAVLSVM